MDDILRIVESLMSFVFASFEMQFEAIHYLEQARHPAKKKLIYQLKRMAESLLRMLDHLETWVISSVEESSEEMLSTSASAREAILTVSKQIPDHPFLEQLATIAQTGHKQFVAELAESEQETESDILARIAKMKKKVQQTLDRIDRL